MTASNVCIGTATANQTAAANTDPNGTYVYSDSLEKYASGAYHFSWTNNSTAAASSIADDMFTPPYGAAKTISSINMSTYGYFNWASGGWVRLTAKFWDVDENAPCPTFESGQFIGSSAGVFWPVEWWATVDLTASGLNYNILPGHRIRAELWVEDNGLYNIGDVQLRYGQKNSVWIPSEGCKLVVVQASSDTTTVGSGSVPQDATLAPGGGFTDLDAFTLQTSAGIDTVGSVTTTLSPSNAYSYIGAIAITNDEGTITYGSLSNPSSAVITVPLSAYIDATASSIQYKVRIAPKAQSAMPEPPGGLYAVQGVVTALSSMNTKTYGDTSATTITIDNQSPENPVWGAVTVGDTQLTLNWTNPFDFSEVLILRNTSPIADAPAEGTTYVQGNTIGSSTLIYIGNLQGFIDTGLTNNTNCYYRIFAKDANGNYSTGAATGPYMPLVPLTVGNGTSPPDLTVVPGSAAVVLDSFTLQTTTATATVTGITVSLTSGSSSALGLVEITSDNGGTVYGSAFNPGSDAVPVVLATNITVTTAPIQYKVRITPKSHANMPSPPGSQYLITGTVTSVTTSQTLSKLYSDSSSAFITVDNLSTDNPVWNNIITLDGQIILNWTNPSDFNQVIVLRNNSVVSDRPAEGVSYLQGNTIGASAIIYAGTLQTFTDTGLSNGTNYFYRIFSTDTNGNYSTGAGIGPYLPQSNVVTLAGNAAASVASLNSISINMPYTNDSNSSNTSTVEYKLASAGVWTSWIAGAPHVPSPFGATISDIPTGIYDVRMTYSDSDGVIGLNPRTVTGLDLSSAKTNAGTATAVLQGISEILVTMPYTQDSNSDNTYSIDYKLTSDSTWVSWTSVAPHSPASYASSITGLAPGLYDVRMTYNDPDGVTGINPRIIAGVDLTGPMTRPGIVTVSTGELSLYVNTPFDKDNNTNNTCQIDYKLSSTGVWMNWSVQNCRISPVYLAGLTYDHYDVRVTYEDPDGVEGAAVQTISSLMPQSDKLIHNSRNANKKNYWAQYGGWGLPGAQYGEFTCATCHEPRSPNIAGIRSFINLMPIPGPEMHFGGPVYFQSKTGPESFGDDSILRDPPPPVSKICEVCHTQTYGHINPSTQAQVHRYNQTETGNHANSNGTDCTSCHTHNTGFMSPW